MIIKRYSFGPCIIEARLPFDVKDTLPFSEFKTNGRAETVYLYDYSFTDKIEAPPGLPAFETASGEVYLNGRECVVYYKKRSGGFYAVRTDFENKRGGRVEFLNEYARLLWDKNILDTVGCEKIAYDNGILIMHASFISFNGYAVLFTAPKQTGKSTQARLWNEYRNAEIINGDKALVYIKDGEVFASGLPYCGSSHICKNASFPVKCIVRLGQGENTIKRLDRFSSVREVIMGSYLPCGADKILTAIEYICNKVPVYEFECSPDLSAVEVLEKTIWSI